MVFGFNNTTGIHFVIIFQEQKKFTLQDGNQYICHYICIVNGKQENRKFIC